VETAALQSFSGRNREREVVSYIARQGVVTIAEAVEEEAAGRPKGRGTTVAFTNMKGGVGKSTLTANLGWYGAYYLDLRVLLVDLDPQFNLSQYVLGTSGYEAHLDSRKKTVLQIFEQTTPSELLTESTGEEIQPEELISHVRRWGDGAVLDLLPSSLHLSFTLKSPGAGKEQLLRQFLDKVRGSYDLILIDCPPTDSVLTTAAYLASDSVLIPVKPEFLSTIGLPLVVKSLEEFNRRFEKQITVLGVVFNASMPKLEDERSRAYVRETAEEHNWTVFRNSISQSDSYPKGSRFGTPIFLTEYARTTKIADFKAVADEFFKELGIG
jgi:chromosome partitioning protein